MQLFLSVLVFVCVIVSFYCYWYLNCCVVSVGVVVIAIDIITNILIIINVIVDVIIAVIVNVIVFAFLC